MRRDELRLADIIEACDMVLQFVNGKTISDFRSDQMMRSAVLHQLMIVGEAASRISPSLQDKYSDVPWRRIVGFRNILVHGYFAVSLEVVWQTVVDQVGATRIAISSVLSAEFPNYRQERP